MTILQVTEKAATASIWVKRLVISAALLLTACGDGERPAVGGQEIVPTMTPALATSAPEQRMPTITIAPPTPEPTATASAEFISSTGGEYSGADRDAVDQLRNAIRGQQVDFETNLREVVSNGQAFMRIESGAVTYNGESYGPGMHVMVSPVPGFENELLFFTFNGAEQALKAAGVNADSIDSFQFIEFSNMPGYITDNGSIVHINPDTGQWEVIRAYRAADLSFDRSAIVAAENPETQLVQFVHSTAIDWDIIPGYVTIRRGDDQIVMQEAEFHQLMQSRWDALSNQEAIDKYAVTSETRIVNFEGINVPITFAHNLTEYTISYDDLYYQDTAHRWLYASYMRYRNGYPDTSFENYLDLVREGKGQYVAPVLASADASTNEFIFVDPAKGMTFVLANTPDNLPIRIHTHGTDEKTAQRMAFWINSYGSVAQVSTINYHLMDAAVSAYSQSFGWNKEETYASEFSNLFINGTNYWINYQNLGINAEFSDLSVVLTVNTFFYWYSSNINTETTEEEWSRMTVNEKREWVVQRIDYLRYSLGIRLNDERR